MEKTKILLDTDLGSDCDDAGALALLHRLADIGNAEILAVTHCASEISGAVTLKAINEWYKRPDIPIGRYNKRKFLEEDRCKIYTLPIMNEYLKHCDIPEFKSAVRVMRQVLAENENVTLVCIGTMNNIAELLKSEADDISALSGIDLAKKSVSNMFVMGGNFEDLSHAEYNIKCDIESAKYVSENFPVPIIYCGFELGVDVFTGDNLKNAPENNPVRYSYYKHLQPLGEKNLSTCSWDPITVYCAVMQENTLYKKSKNIHITFSDDGKVQLAEGGKDYYMIAVRSKEETENILNALIY